jgi:YqaJ-like viral recombinase domain
MTITYHTDVIQGSDEWRDLRCGLLTASEMDLIITPTLKIASNDKERTHLYELLAQRITGYVEPSYISDAMLRGYDDEIEARILYSEKYAPVTDTGFVTNDKWGFTIGCSPDGLVGPNGAIECKSRMQKHQMKTIVEDEMPKEYLIQVQTILLVTEREWCDFISYCGGLPMFVKRIVADEEVQAAIVEAASAFEERLQEAAKAYMKNSFNLWPTERKIDEEIVV